MFGLIVLIIIIGYMSRMLVSNWIEDAEGKTKYRNNYLNTYINHNGQSRDLKTNRYRSVSRDINGDVHLWGKDIGDMNISQKEREKEYQYYKNKYNQGQEIERTTIYWQASPIYDVTKERNILGRRYKDIKTGKILVVRMHNCKDYYVTEDTLKVLRYTDSQIRDMKKHQTYSKEKELDDVAEFQKHIDKQKADLDYIGDPSKGIGSTNISMLKDFWNPKKGVY